MRAPELTLYLSVSLVSVGCVPTVRAQEPASSAPPSAFQVLEKQPPALADTAERGGTPEKDPSAAAESLLIGPGDLLRISVLRESELDQRLRVRDSGEITLMLAGNVAVQGLTPAQAAARIAEKYREGSFLLHPEVSVFIEEYATQEVTVVGQVVHPGGLRLETPHTLIDVIALAGGFTPEADRHVILERGGERIRAFLSNHADDALNADTLVRPGDTIIVPKAGIVYVLGDVAHPGGYVMENDSQLTVLQAIALASGTSKTASEKHVRLVRSIDGLSRSADLPLRDMERGRAPDVALRANDILYIPFSLAKNISLGIADITAAASSALIYAAR
ncbi:MAG TPA: polysaccharide biosynthesis/export family protein [Acidobacteriaceae bacterium]|nr:polysaccharide biosynthesis/export family protein [Acidobacteriaceae bacterium]